jgi:PEP-CTERM motif
MGMRKRLLAGTCIAIALSAAGYAPADATLVYVGSWEVDQGPSWTVVPPAYTGQEVAALLFGGSASDYVISTVDSNPADINGMDWVSTWGGGPCGGFFPCGTLSPDDFVVTENGDYENPGDTSSYVDDWAVDTEGFTFTNYAFRNVPEPLTLSLFGAGLAGAAAMRRRRKANKPA